jgi:hypothetical protein
MQLPQVSDAGAGLLVAMPFIACTYRMYRWHVPGLDTTSNAILPGATPVKAICTQELLLVGRATLPSCSSEAGVTSNGISATSL